MVKNFLIVLKNLQRNLRAIQKTAEATCDLIGNKIANKITSVSKKSPTELHDNETEVGRASPIHICRRKATNY